MCGLVRADPGQYGLLRRGSASVNQGFIYYLRFSPRLFEIFASTAASVVCCLLIDFLNIVRDKEELDTDVYRHTHILTDIHTGTYSRTNSQRQTHHIDREASRHPNSQASIYTGKQDMP